MNNECVKMVEWNGGNHTVLLLHLSLAFEILTNLFFFRFAVYYQRIE